MASKRAQRRKECEGKRRFTDPNAAIRATSAYKYNTGESWQVRAYRCHFCKGWHFGHTPLRYTTDRQGG